MPEKQKKTLNKEIEQMLKQKGADLVGFADVSIALPTELSHMPRAISIGFNRMLNNRTVEKLEELQRFLCRFLKSKGYKYFAIPPDSDRRQEKFISRLYPLFTHKIAATSAGLGWIGKNGLFISLKYGPKVSLATVLTDAPLETHRAIEDSLCGECNLCVEYCPSKAITGREWSRSDPFGNYIDIVKCLSYKETRRKITGKPNCGLCINICPYGRNLNKKTESSIRRSQQWQESIK